MAREKGIHIFQLDIRLKMIILAWLEIELIHYDIAVQHVSDYAIRSSHTT